MYKTNQILLITSIVISGIILSLFLFSAAVVLVTFNLPAFLGMPIMFLIGLSTSLNPYFNTFDLNQKIYGILKKTLNIK
jgi:hypothetical protein